MKRITLTLSALLLALLFPLIVLAATDTAPSTAPAGATTGPSTQPAELKTTGIEMILAGKFDQGLADLKQVFHLTPSDTALGSTLKVLQNYQAFRAASEAERTAEYQATVARVQRCMLAQKLLPDLAREGIETALRKKTDEVGLAFNKVTLGDAFDEATPEQAVKMKDSSLKAITEALAALQSAVDTAKLDKGQFAATVMPLAKTLEERLKTYQQTWKGIDPQTDAGRQAGAKQLSALEDDLADAVTDFESMVSEVPPWRIALMHARLAKQIALDSDKMADQDWYKALLTDAEARGAKASDEAKWYDALNAYTALEELDNSNEKYHQMARTARLHVRVLRLYGGPDAFKDEDEVISPAPKETPTTTTSAPADVLNWKDLVEGVDAEMVRSAIVKLNEFYVVKPDYRKVTTSGLMSIKVLAQTPQAGYSFAGLKDAELRGQFVKAVDGMLDNVAKKDNVDYLDLQLALNHVIAESDRTVKIPVGVLAMEFCDGFLEELDKFSNVIWPHDVSDFEKQINGRFCGVGIQIRKDNGEPLRVVTPLPGSPAHKAGIKTGDVVLTVDGQRTQDVNLDKLVGMIMGEPGTKVKLTVQRRGVPKPFPVELVREEISIRTVKGWKYLPDGGYDYMIDPVDKIGYIRMTQFTDKTSSELDDVLGQFKKDGVRSVIMDLRFNPGGLLRSAGEVSDEFLTGGRIVSTRGVNTPKGTEIDAQPGGKYTEGDLVVMVNEHSASAAEIVSGAMKDWHRAIIVGERSYGKGSVQNVIPIPRHKAYIKLTTAHYYLPSGRCLHRNNGDKVWGVDPDVRVMITPRQMKRWQDIRNKTDLLQDVQPGQMESDLAEQYKADIQLNAAVTLLKLMKLSEKPMTAAAAVTPYEEKVEK